MAQINYYAGQVNTLLAKANASASQSSLNALSNKVGNLENLETLNHGSLVGAVNELWDKVDSVQEWSEEAQQAADTATGALDAVFAHFEKSGAVITADDGADSVPVKSLEAQINFVQEGSGDPSPSNVRDIVGWSGINVWRTNSNMLNASEAVASNYATLTYDSVNDTIRVVGNSARAYHSAQMPGQAPFLRLKAGVTYTLSVHVETADPVRIAFCSSTGTILRGSSTISASGNLSVTYTPTEDVDARIFLYGFYGSSSVQGTGDATFSNIMLNVGSTALTYERYVGNVYNVAFGSTVYGGVLDVESGVLTITHQILSQFGDSSVWSYNSGNNAFRRSTSGLGIKTYEAGNLPSITLNRYKTIERGAGQIAEDLAATISYAGTTLFIRDDTYVSGGVGDVDAFLAANASCQVCYELATPTTVQLTPTEVTTLLGNNTMWADTGDIDVDYRADATILYNKLASAILALGGVIDNG